MTMLPVHLTEQNEDGSYQDGLSFDDYSRGHQFQHKLFESRSSNPPSWAVNLRELSLLLARFLELRARIHSPRIDTPERRIVYAQNKILRNMPRFAAALDKLCAERMASTDPERRCVLERQIRSLDGRLVIDQRGPALICGVIFYFFRCGYDSRETSAALKGIISPVGVRQMTHRLEQLWQKMQSGQDKKPPRKEIARASRRAYYHMKGKPQQLAKEKAARAAETPEQREARLKYHREYYYANRERISAQRKQDPKRRQRAFEEYHSMTPEQREKKAEWFRTHRPERARYKRKWYAKLSPEEKKRQAEKSMKWNREHPEQRDAIVMRSWLKRSRRIPMAVRMKINVLQIHRAPNFLFSSSCKRTPSGGVRL